MPCSSEKRMKNLVGAPDLIQIFKDPDFKKFAPLTSLYTMHHAHFHMTSYTCITKYLKTIAKNKMCIAQQQNVYSAIFHITFFAFRVPFFAFCISCQGWHSCKKSKDFVVYFFVALIKYEIHMKYKKCIASLWISPHETFFCIKNQLTLCRPSLGTVAVSLPSSFFSPLRNF